MDSEELDLEALLEEALEQQDAEAPTLDGRRVGAAHPTRPEAQALDTEEPSAKRQRRSPGPCLHPAFLRDICVQCGALKEELGEAAGEQDPGLALRYIHAGLEISAGEAARLREDTTSRVLSARKLLLVLDLDHTLLNSTRLMDLRPQDEQALQRELEAQPADAPLLFHLPALHLWTKLRPGVRQFLEAARRLFELHIYTMGDRDYAAAMAALLDPERRLFHGGVISAGDSSRAGVKDLDVVLGAEACVLILDDSEHVWPRHARNLLAIQRYIYFPACAQKFGAREGSLLERQTDEDADQGALATHLAIMKQVHEQFFAGTGQAAEEQQGGRQQARGGRQAQVQQPGADVRPILAGIRQRILAGCCILFSRVLPLGCADPGAHPLWHLATSMGAQCVREPGDAVTHVVAPDATEKTRWALKQGKHVVMPAWLWGSMYQWRRAAEANFPVVAAQGGRGKQQQQQQGQEEGGEQRQEQQRQDGGTEEQQQEQQQEEPTT